MLEIHLPFPPSSNRIWKYAGRRVASSPEYLAWKREAWGMFQQQFAAKRPKQMKYFHISIVLQRGFQGTCDGDNRIKPLLDFCQKTIRVIEDDKHCVSGTWVWGNAPTGCIVRLSEVPAPATGKVQTRKISDFWDTLKSREGSPPEPS